MADISPLIDVKEVIPNICVDLKYATADNFLNQVLYDWNRCYMLTQTAEALKTAEAMCESKGLFLKIWDAYRPINIQWKFWHYLPDEHFVADPRKGGRHTRGTAIDVTLITKEGKELSMPTDFDDFSPKAHRVYMGAPTEAIQNRALLQSIMEQSGFVGLPTEWWHFDLKGWDKYPPLDIHP